MRVVRIIGMVVVAFGIGLALSVVSSASNDTAVHSSGVADRVHLPIGAPAASADLTAPAPMADVDPPGPAAATATAAVSAFLGAEIAQDFDASFGLLSSADRTATGTRAQWAVDHGEMPTILAFRIGDVAEGTSRASVTVQLDLRAALDQVSGLVPAHAAGTYLAVAEDQGWRVAFADSVVKPVYPAESLAVDAVRTWARDRQVCRQAAEYGAGLLGAPRRADALCGAHGTVQVGPARILPETAAGEPFLAAFGPAVYDWARVVELHSPIGLDVVVAPLGERWIVIGVLQPRSS